MCAWQEQAHVDTAYFIKMGLLYTFVYMFLVFFNNGDKNSSKLPDFIWIHYF